MDYKQTFTEVNVFFVCTHEKNEKTNLLNKTCYGNKCKYLSIHFKYCYKIKSNFPPFTFLESLS